MRYTVKIVFVTKSIAERPIKIEESFKTLREVISLKDLIDDGVDSAEVWDNAKNKRIDKWK